MNQRELMEKSKIWRSYMALPIVKLLARIGFTSNMLSYLGVALMIGFIFSIKVYPWIAFWLLISALFIDIFLDGALARHLKIASDKGKFVDMICDITVFTLFIIGVSSIFIIKAVPAVLFVFSMCMCKLLLVVRNNLGQKSDWLIHPFAGAFPNILAIVAYIMFFVWLFWSRNYLNETVMILSGLLIMKSLVDFRFIISYKL